MKLSVFRFGLATAVVWGGIVFLVALGNLIWPTYGVAFLQLVDSIYPGYALGKWGFGGAIVGLLYAALDGFVVGLVFAWIYNLFTKNK